jgi:hypothetical protein
MPVKIYSSESSDKSAKKMSINKKPVEFYDPFIAVSPFDNVSTVQPMLPANIDVFSHLSGSLSSLSDDNVIVQSYVIVRFLQRVLNDLASKDYFINYLSRLHITEQEDKTALIEWNFENFRIGFSIDPDSSKSGYYLVSTDHVTTDFIMKTGKIGTRQREIIEFMVNYALENT